jgi:hypothetical protein
MFNEAQPRNAKGDTKMNAPFRFAAYPSNDLVANGVTVLVSAWFLVAAGAILGDPASPYTQRAVEAKPAQVAVAEVPGRATPHVHYTVRVMGKRTTG